METDWKTRILLKLTSTKTWFLLAAMLLSLSSYIGGVTGTLPAWFVQTGVICGIAGGCIYTVATAYQNAQEALAKKNTTSTTVTASTSTAKTVEKIAGVEVDSDSAADSTKTTDSTKE